MSDSAESTDSKPRKPRTRKAEVISGLTILVASIGTYFANRAGSSVEKIEDDRGKICEKTVANALEKFKKESEAVMDSKVAYEKERAKEREVFLENDLRELRLQIFQLFGRRR